MRIMTYNIRGGLGMDNVRSIARISETVRLYSPDVVCFQEVHKRLLWSGHEDQPERLAHLLGRSFHFQRLLTFGHGGYGIGIATRAIPRYVKEHLLPSRGEQRGLLEVGLSGVLGFPLMRVFCTHWGLDEGERLKQARFCVDVLRAENTPTLFCGDLNETKERAGVSFLLSESGFVDAGAEGSLPTFPSIGQNVRIDYLLHSSAVRSDRFEVIHSTASDHLPIVADIFRVSRETR